MLSAKTVQSRAASESSCTVNIVLKQYTGALGSTTTAPYTTPQTMHRWTTDFYLKDLTETLT